MKKSMLIAILAVLVLLCGCTARKTKHDPEPGSSAQTSADETTPAASATASVSSETTPAASATASVSSETAPAASATASVPSETAPAAFRFQYHFASREEGQKLLLANHDYYAGFSENDLDFRMQKKNADMQEYLAFAKEQVLDFTEEEKALADSLFSEMERTLAERGCTLPPLDEIILIKTTMQEEPGAAGYTHGTQIYLHERILNWVEFELLANRSKAVFWHELFHCLTRCSPEFRTKMYHLIHFTVVDKDFELPPSVFEYHISNPDVEHHNAYATFRINGEDINCFTDFVTAEHFHKPGDTFFTTGTTALIPIDGRDMYYTPEQAENFNEVFGTNTRYVIDPEECLADNFSYAMLYGKEGPGGSGYHNPEIIEGILEILQSP